MFPDSDERRMPRQQREPSELIRDEAADEPTGAVPQLALFEAGELPRLNDWPAALEGAEGTGSGDPGGADTVA